MANQERAIVLPLQLFTSVLNGREIVRVLFVAPEMEKPDIKLPDGQVVKMTPASGLGYSFSRVNQCGIYTIEDESKTKKRQIAVNLFSRQESNLKPVDNPIAEQEAISQIKTKTEIRREYFRDLLILALIIIIIEWAIYHRRILS